MIDVGTHEVTVKSTALANSSKGNLQIVVEFENDAHDTISAFLATTEAAWQYTEEKLRTLGWDPAANGYRFEDLNNDPSPIALNQVQIVVDEEVYDGKRVKKVKFINQPGGKVLERLAETEATYFASLLRQRLTGSTRPGVAPPARQAQAAKRNDDEIPF